MKKESYNMVASVQIRQRDDWQTIAMFNNLTDAEEYARNRHSKLNVHEYPVAIIITQDICQSLDIALLSIGELKDEIRSRVIRNRGFCS